MRSDLERCDCFFSYQNHTKCSDSNANSPIHSRKDSYGKIEQVEFSGIAPSHFVGRLYLVLQSTFQICYDQVG